MFVFNKYIQSLEEKWNKEIQNFFLKRFEGHFIPSHDFDHHIRTWTYAKEIIIAIEEDEIVNKEFITDTFWACMFHDLGLTVTSDEDHGKASSELFREFVHKQEEIEIYDIERVKDAIIHHDNKQYSPKNDNTFTPYLVLTLADDLDAFGYIGVYRYIEIYTMRGIKAHELADRVLLNLESRFNNFKSWCEKYSDFYLLHKKRYDHTFSYFKKLKGEIRNSGYHNYYLIEAMGVLNIILENIRSKRNVLADIQSGNYSDRYVRDFFENLKNFT